jgi:hypothetical protein
MQGSARIGSIALAVLCFAACSSGAKRTATTTIDERGGTLAIDGAKIVVLPGAVSEATQFTIRQATGTFPTGYEVLSGLFSFEPRGLTFAQPVAVTLRFEGAGQGATVLWTRPGSSTDFEPVGGTVAGQEITASVGHFSRGFVGRPDGTAPDGGVDARPADAGMDNTVSRVLSYPQGAQHQIDLLFVVDNSGSMAEEQQLLLSSFPTLIDGLRDARFGDDPDSDDPCTPEDPSGCKIPDVHIGVVTTDLGAGGYSDIDRCPPDGDRAELQNSPKIAGCTPPTDRYISYAAGTTNISGGNSIAQVSNAFDCIAKVGDGGCGFEQPLEAMRLALDSSQTPANAGFLRQSAALAVMLITDEDDCSAAKGELFDPSQNAIDAELGFLDSFRCFEFGISCDVNDRTITGPRQSCQPAGDWLHDIAGYVDFLEQLKPWGRVVIAAIAGVTSPVEVGLQNERPALLESCRSAAGVAVPAIRIEALTDAMGPNGRFTNICTAAFEPAMRSLASGLLDRLSAQCISGPLATPSGALACQKGDAYGTAGRCANNCLDQVDCELSESVGTADPVAIPRCPAALWYPTNWETERDCQSAGACPCWRLVKKEAAAPAGKRCDPAATSPYALDILRANATPTDAVAELTCRGFDARWTDAALDALSACD